MQNPTYDGVLECGCICAGHMEEDLQAAEARETTLRNAGARRARWPDRKGWKRSAQGNLTIATGGYRITIFPRHNCWSGIISHVACDIKHTARRHYESERSAQLAPFDAMIFLEQLRARKVYCEQCSDVGAAARGLRRGAGYGRR